MIGPIIHATRSESQLSYNSPSLLLLKICTNLFFSDAMTVTLSTMCLCFFMCRAKWVVITNIQTEYFAMVQLYAAANYNLEEARRLYSQQDHLHSLLLRGIASPQVSCTSTILAATRRLIDHGLFRMPTHAQGRGRSNYSPEIDENMRECECSTWLLKY